MGKKKIFNDPIYGLISFPFEIIYDIIAHPYFQRLRRISQCGLTQFVYPGATHSRFQHAMGALHLMDKAIQVLRQKGVVISDSEYEAVCLSILLHDLGHGPFSHALENHFISASHEGISLAYFELLNLEFDGKLNLAIRIFTNSYHKKFLFQLVSGQLDMDRLDYLSRDSFYTGVAEGVIGYDRIISMLNVVNNQLVVEEKGIYSIEKFLLARKIMYWQVYLHKTAVGAEQMLISLFKRLKKTYTKANAKFISPRIIPFYEKNEPLSPEILNDFSELDDHDIWQSIKNLTASKDFVLSYLSKNLLQRKIFKIKVSKTPFSSDFLINLRQRIGMELKVEPKELNYLILNIKETNHAYKTAQNEIQFQKKDNHTVPFSKLSESIINKQEMVNFFLCYPRI